MIFTLALVPILGGALAITAALSGGGSSTSASLLIALSAVAAMSLWQLQDTLRRTLLADLRPAACIPGDAISYLGQLVILWILWKLGRLTLPAALLTIGTTSAAAGVIQAVQVGLRAVSRQQLRRYAIDFWFLGRWTALSQSAGLLTGVGFFWTLRYFHGLGATAAFAAMVLPLKLANPILLGTSNLLIPAVSRSKSSGGHRAAFLSALKYWVTGGVLVLPYFALLVLIPSLILKLLVGRHSPYLADGALLRLYTLAMSVYFVEFCLAGWLAGLGESRSNFQVQVINAAATVLIALPATALDGLRGLVYGSMAAAAISALAQICISFKFFRLAFDPHSTNR